MDIQKQAFGTAPDGQAVELYTLTNSNRMTLKVMTFGGRMVELHVPDRGGRVDDIIMGFDSLLPYTVRNPYFGAVVGRCANRISGARFTLNGICRKVDCNAAPHHLHGGTVGFDKRVWQASTVESPEGQTLELTLHSEDGDQGYPGDVFVTVQYTLTEHNELRLRYRAHCSADTILNLTNHNYFNLAGHNAGTVFEHCVRIDAGAVTPADAAHIPDGTIRPVDGTLLDLRKMTRLGERLCATADDEQLAQSNGFDINYVLNGFDGTVRPVAEVYEPHSGRRMTVRTNMRAMQFYTANYINGSFIGKGGYAYPRYCGLCLETQDFPNSPNTPAFPPAVLRPGEEYRQDTVYGFSW